MQEIGETGSLSKLQLWSVLIFIVNDGSVFKRRKKNVHIIIIIRYKTRFPLDTQELHDSKKYVVKEN